MVPTAGCQPAWDVRIRVRRRRSALDRDADRFSRPRVRRGLRPGRQPHLHASDSYVTSAAYNNRNWLTLYGPPETDPIVVTHDDNGNMTSNGTIIYGWDAENRLVSVGQAGGGTPVATFAYDGQGRRVSKTAGSDTRTYLFDGHQLAEERLSTGGATKYFDGPGIDQHLGSQTSLGVVSYFASDHLGSVTDVARSNGVITLTRQYDPWGNLLSGGSTRGYAFTGREWDAETGLYYYRARYYDPKIGRFITQDPIGFAGGVNLYTYVNNNPVRYADPLGLQAKMGDFALNPFRCYGSMMTAGNLAGMMLAGGDFGGPKDPNGDKRAHCLAFCQLRKGCGPFWGGMVLTGGLGFGKEGFDTVCFFMIRPVLGAGGITVPCTGPADPDDMAANLDGAATCDNESCEKRCSKFSGAR